MHAKKRSGWLLLACLAFTALSLGALRAHEGEEGGGPGGPGGPGNRPEPPVFSEDFVDRLSQRLKLSDKQREKVSAIVEEGRPGLRKTMDQMKAVQKQMKDQMRDIGERIRAELDNEQKEKFDEMKMRMRDGGGGPGMMGPGGGPGGGMGMENMPPEMRERMEKMRQGPQGGPRKGPPENKPGGGDD